jgi:hypothetical protein
MATPDWAKRWAGAAALLATAWVLGADTFVLPSRTGDVPFPHARHFSVADCVACHHTSQPGEAMTACHVCHREQGGEARSAHRAFHDSCIGCHDKLLRAGLQTGPSKRCSACHAIKH